MRNMKTTPSTNGPKLWIPTWSVPVFLVKELTPHYERRRQHSFYRLLRRTAGLFLIPGVWCHQIRHSFPYQISGKKNWNQSRSGSMPLPRDLLKPAGIRTALRKAMNALTVRLHFTALVRSQKCRYGIRSLKNGYMNGSVVDIHGGYDYF